MVVVVQIHFSPVTQRQQPVLTESTGTRSSLGIKNFTVDLIILRLSGVLLFLLCFEQGYDLSSNRAPEAPSTHLQLRYGLEPEADELPIEDLAIINEEAGS